MDETKSRPRRKSVAAKKAAPAKAPAKAPASVGAQRPRKPPAGAPDTPVVDRDTLVRMAAYFRAERRGFVPGYEIEDWLAAEAEVSGPAKGEPPAKPRKTVTRKPRTG